MIGLNSWLHNSNDFVMLEEKMQQPCIIQQDI